MSIFCFLFLSRSWWPFFGANKPSNLDFLEDTVTELKKLMREGYAGIPLELRYIICDAPARALVKAIIQFNGRYGCDFCDVKGTCEQGIHI